jgi:subtilisin-like proprotein convertase family protein
VTVTVYPLAAGSTQTFSNLASITIPSAGPGVPYPSSIAVSGVTDTVKKVTVTLRTMNHTWPDDVDVLLVGPTGQTLVIMSDAGSSIDMINVTLTLDDTAGGLLGTADLPSGTYKPTDYWAGDPFAGAPAGPYNEAAPSGAATFGSVFNGLDPNGTWSLYVVDDNATDSGNISGGWSLAITSAPCCTLSVPADINTTNDAGICGAVVTYPAPTGTPGCGVVSSTPASGSTFPLGTTPVSVTCSGSAETGTFNVTVTDGEGPVVTPPADVVLDQSLCCGTFGGVDPATNAALATFLSGGSAVDNCVGAVTPLTPQVGGFDVTAATCFENGSTPVTFRFQDSAIPPNVGTAAANVVVRMYGDLNLDGTIDATDVVLLRGYLNFAILPGTPPFNAPEDNANVNHDVFGVDATDWTVMRGYLSLAVACLAP